MFGIDIEQLHESGTTIDNKEDVQPANIGLGES